MSALDVGPTAAPGGLSRTEVRNIVIASSTSCTPADLHRCHDDPMTIRPRTARNIVMADRDTTARHDDVPAPATPARPHRHDIVMAPTPRRRPLTCANAAPARPP